MNNKRKYTILILLFICFSTLISCVDDLESCVGNEEQGEFINGYSLKLAVTLDNMGGTRRANNLNEINPMKEWEDYIDPQKFRVLFFNDKEQFLFESKSRWIKQLAPTENGFSQWLVSIPMYSYGNDVEYNWDWDSIRTALTTKKFRIAILANRPEQEYYPGFNNTGLDKDPRWFDNTGPHWKRNHTSWGAKEKDTIKTIMDLHHCQYDPIYHGKSYDVDKDSDEDYYDFIAGDYNLNSLGLETDDYKSKRPKMGATSSWVHWGDKDNVKTYKGERLDSYDNDYPSTDTVRYTILPDQKHPIPMYGIQVFDPIKNWIKGTPFNLSKITENQTSDYTFKSIALLRSVVKLELCILKSLFGDKKPPLVTLWYSNIYSRCEPLDIWTPTEEIWKDHNNGCEWEAIMDYGLISSAKINLGNTNRNSDTKNNYQKTVSWFYGVWKEHQWPFLQSNGAPAPFVDNSGGTLPDYPQIFNTCIQRNKIVICNEKGDLSDKYNDDYWHYIVYTGERNMIDPNKLPATSGTNYAISWMFKDGRYSGQNSQYYFIPIADYETSTTNKEARKCFGPYSRSSDFTKSQLPGNMNSYANTLRNNITSQDEWPWPLLRNHVYRIIIGRPDNRLNRATGESVFSIQSEESYSESLVAE